MELRLYTFVNFYLSSIQQGVQTGHCAVDLVRKYTANGNPLRRDITSEQIEMTEEWADSHKTFIILNGGNAEGVQRATDIIATSGVFPWAVFKEDEASLNGIQTCVGVVLPEFIFNAQRITSATGPDFFKWENEDGEVRIFDSLDRYYDLIALVRGSRLAS